MSSIAARSASASLAAALVALAANVADAQTPWTDLFDHQSLAGWSPRGGAAKYTVEDGVIVGRAVAGEGNTFLCTDHDFDDFELEVEFACDSALNSGVQVWSEFADGRVRGPQIEIDEDVARGRFWAGGIYEEGKRGWLDPDDGEHGARGVAFGDVGRRLAKPGAWGWLHVVARGGEITAWLDGELRGHVRDEKPARGFIGLQVHAVDAKTLAAAPKGELAVRFRNVRIRALPKVATGMGDSDVALDAKAADATAAASLNRLADDERRAGWRLLWNGTNGDGWRSATAAEFPKHGWSFRDGVLTVGAKPADSHAANATAESAGGGDIITRERFSDFELRVDFLLTPGCNSGIKYFVQPDLHPITASGAPAATGSAIGCEYQLLDDALHPDAKLGRDGDRTLASLYDLIPPAADKPARKIGEWNTARIVVRGIHVEHWLNGTRVLEYERGSDAFRKLVAESKYKNLPHFGEWRDGHVLLQEHGSEVSFRNVMIRRLPND